MRAWAKRFGEEFVTTKQLIDLPELAEALAGLAGVDTHKLELKGAAAALRNMVGLLRLGYKVHRVKGKRVTLRAGGWRTSMARLTKSQRSMHRNLPMILLSEEECQPFE